MKFTPIYIFVCSILVLGSISCKKDGRNDELIDLEQETFTSLQATFFPAGGGGNQIIMAYEDATDGSSAVPTAASSGPLAVDTEYEMKVLLFNRAADPAKNLTTNVVDMGSDYQLYVTATPSNLFQSVEYLDLDANGQPIGLNMRFKTSERFSTGSVKVSFRKNPDKSIMVTAGNTVDNAVGGENLIDATFQVVVQ